MAPHLADPAVAVSRRRGWRSTASWLNLDMRHWCFREHLEQCELAHALQCIRSLVLKKGNCAGLCQVRSHDEANLQRRTPCQISRNH